MASVELRLVVGADHRVRPAVRFTLRPIRSRDQNRATTALGGHSGPPLHFCCEKCRLGPRIDADYT